MCAFRMLVFESKSVLARHHAHITSESHHRCQAKALELQAAAGKVADVFLRIENTLREDVSTVHCVVSVSYLGEQPATLTRASSPRSRSTTQQEARESAFQAKYGEQWTRMGLSSAKVMGETWEEVRRFQQLFATAQVCQ